ncbi:MAG: rod shape-determining protein MreC [Cyclobacteriaceae bacterium]
MQRLFLFLYQQRAFLIFIFLEVLCVWLIVQNNRYQGARFFNSSNKLVAGMMQTSRGVSEYFKLGEVNEQLAAENARLKKELQQISQSMYPLDRSRLRDQQYLNQFDYLPAKVINNSTRRFTNFITIDRGEKDGVNPDMAVINSNGVVGKVKSVSERFSVITSILHTDMRISSKIKRTGDLCTTQWDGTDPYIANLAFVPRHVKPMVGDTVVTSGYNAIFPENIPVGIISDVQLQDNSPWYDIDLALSADLNEISYVYLVRNDLRTEIDSLEMESGVKEGVTEQYD